MTKTITPLLTKWAILLQTVCTESMRMCMRVLVCIHMNVAYATYWDVYALPFCHNSQEGIRMKGLSEVEKKEIEQRADTLLRENNISTLSGVDVLALAKQLGFTVWTSNLPDSDDGFILVNPNVDKIPGFSNNKVIVVNAERPYVTKRFIIAHEIGHYVLSVSDSKEEEIFAARESQHGRSDDENDIDYFAACLLMPETSFKAQYEDKKQFPLNQLVSELSEVFQVPAGSALRRLEELNLIGKCN